jgi:hypothetical protein
MFVKISHKGLNRQRDASKLHQMISEGYHHKFQKEEKPIQPLPEDKEVFIEAVLQEENAVLLGGLKYA